MSHIDSLNMAELMGEAERLDTPAGGADFLENFVRMPEKEGNVVVRLLPPAKGKKFFCATRTHRVHNKSLHCTRELINGKWVDSDPKHPCVICKYYNELWRDSEKTEGKAALEMQSQARAIKPIERYYYNCIVRSQVNSKTQEVEKNVGPKILSIGKTVHQKIVRAIVGDPAQEEKGYGDVTEIKQGRDFKIMKRLKISGKDSFPNYDDSKFMDPSPLGDKDQVEKWLGNLHDLATLRILKSPDEMAIELKKHLGLIQDDDAKAGFDLSEFKKKPSTVSVEDQVMQAVNKQEAKPASKPDEVLAEQDFLDELKNM